MTPTTDRQRQDRAERDRVAHVANTQRRVASAGLVLTLPAALLSGLIVLSSSGAGRCLTYGEGCAAGVPGSWIIAVFALAVAFGVLVLACPDKRLPFASARAWMLGLHCGALLTGASMILSHA